MGCLDIKLRCFLGGMSQYKEIVVAESLIS
jgi:hypothetical protein